MTLSREAVEGELCRRALRRFVRQVWRTIEPASPFIDGWHIDAICEHLEAVTAGSIRDLLINVPPGTGKSLLVSVLWPAWEWATSPSLRFFAASYGGGLSVRDQLKCRDVVQSPWYELAYPAVRLRRDQNQKIRMDTTAKGWRIATSVGGVGTGEHPDRIIIDDPHNTKQAESDAERQTALDWYDRTVASRGVVRGARTVVVMQRLHERDLTGHLLERGGWTHLCLPMRRDAVPVSASPLGFVDPRTEGDLLWPAAFDEAKVTTLAAKLGSYGAAGQLQQKPVPAGGAMVKREWFKFYRELPADLDEWLQSWDCSFKDKASSDYVCGGVFARKGAAKYLVHRVKERLGMPGTVQAIRSVSASYPKALTKLVEGKANGPAVIQTLQWEIDGLIEVEPDGGKVSRFAACTPTIEAGNFYLPDPSIASWVEDYLGELLAFPMAAHDDQVDMTSQALNRWSGGDGFDAFIREQVAKAAKGQPEGQPVRP